MKMICLIDNSYNLKGINPERFRLTWYPEKIGPGMQTSYRIVIRDNSLALPSDSQICLYDSGWVPSTQSANVEQDGFMLKGGRAYTLEVSACYDTGECLSSGPLPFYTALPPEDWRAIWIVNQAYAKSNDFIFFRYRFSVDKAQNRFLMYFSAHTYGQCYMNGELLSGHVSPAPSHIYRNKLYLIYDITDKLREGENTIACLLHYMNSNSQNVMNGLPGLLVQVDKLSPSGKETVLVSDKGWLVLDDTPFTPGRPCQQWRSATASTEYDAGHEAAKWLSGSYDDRHWKRASFSGINIQSWELAPQRIPENIVHERISPVPCNVFREGFQVFDTGKIVSGWVQVSMPKGAGERVTIRYGEDLEPDGTVAHRAADEGTETYLDICRLGSQAAEYAADLSFKSFRYFEIVDCPKMISADDVCVISTGTDIGKGGSFSCSSELLNKIYSACIQTQKNNAVNQLVDCPHREQAQYVMDSCLQAETLMYNFESFTLLNKVLRDFADAQMPDGRMPIFFPCCFEEHQFRLVSPEWDLEYFWLLWKLYRYFGDIRLLGEYYPVLKKIAGFYLSKRSPHEGLAIGNRGWKLSDWPNPKVDRDCDWNISDWPYPNVDDDCDYLTIENCMLFRAIKILAQAAVLLGFTGDAAFYNGQAKQVQQSVITWLFDEGQGLFRDGLGSNLHSQATNAAALYAGIFDGEKRAALQKRTAEMPFTCKSRMSQPLLESMFENDYAALAYKILTSPKKPGWGIMVLSGHQTIWEGFDDIESHTHAWNAYPARLMQQFIAGIDARDIGFGKLRIRPFIPEDLQFANAQVITPQGPVCTGWRKEKDVLLFEFGIPANIHAEFIVPKECKATLGYVLLNPGRQTLSFPVS